LPLVDRSYPYCPNEPEAPVRQWSAQPIRAEVYKEQHDPVMPEPRLVRCLSCRSRRPRKTNSTGAAGWSDRRILENYPGLTVRDLRSALSCGLGRRAAVRRRALCPGRGRPMAQGAPTPAPGLDCPRRPPRGCSRRRTDCDAHSKAAVLVTTNRDCALAARLSPHGDRGVAQRGQVRCRGRDRAGG